MIDICIASGHVMKNEEILQPKPFKVLCNCTFAVAA